MYTHLARRIRWSSFGFVGGFVMLMLFWLNIWVAVAGFAVMLTAALIIYGSLKKITTDQLRSLQQGGLSLTTLFARLSGRFLSK